MAAMERVSSDWFSARALFQQVGDLVLVMEVLIVLETVAFGQVSVTGRVIDENNAAVAGARILLGPAISTDSQALSLQTLSDPTGSFTLTLQKQGNYLVSVELTGYFR